MNEIITAGAAATMTSIELVAIINDLRDPGRAVLEHSDFFKKIEKVLGGGVGKFSGTYIHPQNGQTYSCYNLPKREASLMVMSESYTVQARVYDSMVELDTKPAPELKGWRRFQHGRLRLFDQCDGQRIMTQVVPCAENCRVQLVKQVGPIHRFSAAPAGRPGNIDGWEALAKIICPGTAQRLLYRDPRWPDTRQILWPDGQSDLDRRCPRCHVVQDK